MKRALIQIIAAGFLVSPCLAQDQSLEVTDALEVTQPEEFAQEAAETTLFELHASAAALRQAVQPVTKNLAQNIIVDRSHAAKKMLEAAAAEGVTTPTSIDAADAAKLEDLRLSSGEDFDYAFMAQQWESHQEMVALFTAYLENGEPGPLNDFARESLPELQDCLSEFQSRTNALTQADLAY